MGTPGHIYILTQEHMPNLVKIGRTTRAPEERAAEISAVTGVPGSFKVYWAAFVQNHERAESLIHSRLSRYRAQKEFFQLSSGVAMDKVMSILREYNIQCTVVKSTAEAEAFRKAEEKRRREEEERLRREREQRQNEERRQKQIHARAKVVIDLENDIEALHDAIKHPSYQEIGQGCIGLFLGGFCFLGGLAGILPALIASIPCFGWAIYNFNSASKEKQSYRDALEESQKSYRELTGKTYRLPS